MLRQNWIILLWAALLFVCFSSHASCDETDLTVSLAAKQEYNDNIFFSTTDEVDDTITTISPGVSYRQRNEVTDVYLSTLFDAGFYRDNDDFNAVDNRTQAKLGYKFTERFSFSGSAGYTKDSRVDRDFDETGQIVGGYLYDSPTRYRETADLGTTYLLDEITGVTVSLGFVNEHFDDDEFADYTLGSVNLEAYRNLSTWLPLTTAFFNLGYYRYENEDDSESPVYESKLYIDNIDFSGGLSTQLTEKLDAYVHVGGRYTRDRQKNRLYGYRLPDTKSDGWGLTASAGMHYASEFTSYKLSFSHNIRPQSGERGAVEYTSLMIDLDHRFAENMRFGISGGAYKNRSTEGTGATDIDEYSFRLRPYLAYDFTKDLSLEGSYAWNKTEYRDTDTNADRNYALLRLSYRHHFLQ